MLKWGVGGVSGRAAPKRVCTFPVSCEDAFADELANLCRDRRFDATELLPPNAWYGHAQIIKAAAGWTQDRALKVALPHGVEYSGYPLLRKRERVPVLTHHAEPHQTEYAAKGRRYMWPLAAPFLYLERLQAGLGSNARSGTLYFPAHSYAAPADGVYIDPVYEADRLAEGSPDCRRRTSR
jgi:hypothetical protein